jgi:ligand-binding sensor domain-containing protein/signal transduction histidine kinase
MRTQSLPILVLLRAFPVFALLLAAGLSAAAQRQHIRFSRLGTDQGLSQSNATCIFQDSRGFVWIGTRDGLNQYDGYRFTIFKNKSGDANSLSHSFVTSVVEDRQGGIWIGTWGGGVNRFDRDKHLFVRYSLHKKNGPAVADNFINTLMVDSKGRLWIGTDGDGVDIMDPATGKFENIHRRPDDPAGFGDNDITTLLEDSRHDVWVGTFNGGLSRYEPESGRVQRYLHLADDPSSLSSNTVSKIYEDTRRRLWIGTRGGGLDRLDRETGFFRQYKHDPHNPNSLGHDVVVAIAEDDKDNLWIGTENGGLCVMDANGGGIQNYVLDEIDNTSLGNNSVYSIYRDHQANMWVGTYSNGINIFNKDANRFTTFRHNSASGSLGNNNVLYFLEDAARTIWIGTDGGGLEAMDPATGVIRQYRHSPGNANSMGGDYVLSIHEDKDGRLWTGTWGDGITVLDKDRKKFLHYRNRPGDSTSLGGDNIYSITEDRDQDLWLGSYGSGLDLYDRKKNSFRHFRHDPANTNSLSSDRVHTLLADQEGYLWIGTFDGGLNRLDKRTGRFTHYLHSDTSNSLSNNSINSIFEDHRGDLWIGTSNGLNCMDRRTGRFQVWHTGDGLPNNLVYAVEEDARHNFWISTNYGISKFDVRSGVFQNFTSADGLQSNEFKPHSCLLSSSGLLYFGGVRGFNEFSPDSIKGHLKEAPLLITNFQLFNKEVPVSTDSFVTPLNKDITETRQLTLSYSNTVVSFEFATLNYTTPERNQYAYTLEGFDTGWNYIGSRRMATYTNIDPGNYVLKIKARNGNGGWGHMVRSLAIRITPPFWRTWWFRLLVVLAFAGATFGFHIIRLRTLQGQKKKLEAQVAKLLDRAVAQGKYEMASEVLHDIGNAVVGFSSYLTRMKRLLEAQSPQNLSSLAGFFRENRSPVDSAIGPAKTGAIIDLLEGMARSQKESQEEMRKAVAEQMNGTAKIQEILHIQRQYITGQESQERKAVDLRKIVNDATAMLSATFQNKGITVDLPGGNEPFVIKGDRTRLMQLLLNLLKNSVDAMEGMDGGKTITIEVRRQQQDLLIRIRDSGHGFDEQTAGKLLVRGFSTKPSAGGVGLYQCRTILESHNGMLDLSSEGPERGCLAVVTFQA